MSLLDRFRKAERRGREQIERARQSFEEAQSMMRRKMRIHPRIRRTRETPPTVLQSPEEVTRMRAGENIANSAARESASPREPAARAEERPRPIISVNGKDVAHEDLDRAKSDSGGSRDVKKPAA
ncbi:MAG TPA: hypothetical protein VFA76_15210 [Terriglobales bacterium]|nr:hypothetical protein [Terriglobales bacterium]